MEKDTSWYNWRPDFMKGISGGDVASFALPLYLSYQHQKEARDAAQAENEPSPYKIIQAGAHDQVVQPEMARAPSQASALLSGGLAGLSAYAKLNALKKMDDATPKGAAEIAAAVADNQGVPGVTSGAGADLGGGGFNSGGGRGLNTSSKKATLLAKLLNELAVG